MTMGTAKKTTSSDLPPGFRRALMRWYRVSGRHTLPWRQTRDPYAILVSEVMLQQTQVERVLPYYTAWLERWPTAESLAQASVGDVIRAWGGLGYNRRAVNLHRTAAAIEADGGRFPADTRSLVALPGVGPYTANAVASFAFEQPVPVADTNIERVLARAILGVASPKDVPQPRIIATALSLLPARTGRHHNLALMDLGALVCAARKPTCDACPVRVLCAWRVAGYPSPLATASATPPFAGTARFARGRIIDALRTAESLSTRAICACLPPKHAALASEYLVALQREGLIEQDAEGDWRLPVTRAG